VGELRKKKGGGGGGGSLEKKVGGGGGEGLGGRGEFCKNKTFKVIYET